MHKTAIAGVAALGLLTVGFTVMGHPASFNQAKAEGGRAGVRVTRHSRLAMLGADQSGRTLLAADLQSASLARSVLV